MEYVFFVVFAAFILYFAWRFARGGSLVGALLGGSIEKEYGEISLQVGGLTSQTLKVYAMRSSSGERFVGVAIVSKAPVGASMTPFRLTYGQAQELASILSQTCDAKSVS